MYLAMASGTAAESAAEFR